MVRLESRVIELTSSSKSMEFEVTSLLPDGKTGTFEKVQVPVTVSSCDKEAGPPDDQSSLTRASFEFG